MSSNSVNDRLPESLTLNQNIEKDAVVEVHVQEMKTYFPINTFGSFTFTLRDVLVFIIQCMTKTQFITSQIHVHV